MVFFTVILIFLLLWLYSNKLPNIIEELIKNKNTYSDNFRPLIVFCITLYNFFIALITSFWNAESQEIIIYRKFISILERASDIAKS